MELTERRETEGKKKERERPEGEIERKRERKLGRKRTGERARDGRNERDRRRNWKRRARGRRKTLDSPPCYDSTTRQTRSGAGAGLPALTLLAPSFMNEYSPVTRGGLTLASARTLRTGRARCPSARAVSLSSSVALFLPPPSRLSPLSLSFSASPSVLAARVKSWRLRCVRARRRARTHARRGVRATTSKYRVG